MFVTIAVCINFSVTFSYIFENIVKILTGRKFDMSFVLEVPLLSGEILTNLASPGKIPFDRLFLFIAFDNDLHNTLAVIFTSLGGIISKQTAFLCQVHSKG